MRSSASKTRKTRSVLVKGALRARRGFGLPYPRVFAKQRRALGISQKTFASGVGVSHSLAAKRESGAAKVSQEMRTRVREFPHNELSRKPSKNGGAMDDGPAAPKNEARWVVTYSSARLDYLDQLRAAIRDHLESLSKERTMAEAALAALDGKDEDKKLEESEGVLKAMTDKK